MYLTATEQKLFYRLYYKAGTYVNGQMKLADVKQMHPRYCDLESAQKIADAMRAHPEYMQKMAEDSELGLKENEREILAGWARSVTDEFVVVDHSYLGSILVSKDAQRVYLVQGLRRPLADFFGEELPVRVTTCLMPFKGKIITDGFFDPEDDSLPPQEESRYLEAYGRALMKHNIQTTL